MLKKGPEKAMPDYQIKEILSYGDKVNDQSERGNLVSKDDDKDSSNTSGGQFGTLAIEVNKLEDTDGDIQ